MRGSAFQLGIVFFKRAPGDIKIAYEVVHTAFRLPRELIQAVEFRPRCLELALGFFIHQARSSAFAVEHLLPEIGFLGAIELIAGAAGIGAGARGFQACGDDAAFNRIHFFLRILRRADGFFARRLETLASDTRKQLAFRDVLPDIHEKRIDGTRHRRTHKDHMLRLNPARQAQLARRRFGGGSLPVLRSFLRSLVPQAGQ